MAHELVNGPWCVWPPHLALAAGKGWGARNTPTRNALGAYAWRHAPCATSAVAIVLPAKRTLLVKLADASFEALQRCVSSCSHAAISGFDTLPWTLPMTVVNSSSEK